MANKRTLLFFIALTALVLLLSLPEEVAGFDMGKYCRPLCKKGKGGNLCKCSAVHFAGKRLDNVSAGKQLGEGVFNRDYNGNLEDNLDLKSQALNGYGSLPDDMFSWDTPKDRARANR